MNNRKFLFQSVTLAQPTALVHIAIVTQIPKSCTIFGTERLAKDHQKPHNVFGDGLLNLLDQREDSPVIDWMVAGPRVEFECNVAALQLQPWWL